MDQSAFILRTTALLLLLLACVTCTDIHFNFVEGPVTEYNSRPYGVKGRVTGIRLWEHPDYYITGLQFEYNHWFDEENVVGYRTGNTIEMRLLPGETIIQISGKSDDQYLKQLQFVTNRGRFLAAGHPYGSSFNYYAHPLYEELESVSGKYNEYGITSLQAHWASIRHYNFGE